MDRERTHATGFALVAEAMSSQSERQGEVSAQLLDCLAEHVDQLVVVRGNDKKSEAHKAELQLIRTKALNIIEEVLPCIGRCCEEFCHVTGIRHRNVSTVSLGHSRARA